MLRALPRLMLAAPRSGGGKTTLACGLLQVLQDLALRPAAFKCGPDYIDPLFHRRIVGAKSGNLDLFFTDAPTVRALLAKGSEGCGIALLEGVMGYYDGLAPGSTKASSYHLAQVTGTPVILVLDAGGACLSLGAQVHGFASFRPDANIQGVILNKCSKSLYKALAETLEQQTGVPVLGYLPREERFALESRHLGLVTAAEVTGLKDKVAELAALMRQTVDIEKLLAIAGAAPSLECEAYTFAPVAATHPRLAVAQDKAFAFYYEENLRMLWEMGVELAPFSPLQDEALPKDIDGLYLGGGYPELYAPRLAEEGGLRTALIDAIRGGMPTVAECGGFLYLQQQLADEDGSLWPMLGVLPGESRNENRLKQFGYVTVTANRDNMLCKAGESIRGHEFHYWHSTHGGDDFTAGKPGRDVNWPCMVAGKTMVAGFPHMYWPSNPDLAANFVRAMAAYREAKG